eukprot:365658-Chlamydomonas_euryale.AAC.11
MAAVGGEGFRCSVACCAPPGPCTDDAIPQWCTYATACADAAARTDAGGHRARHARGDDACARMHARHGAGAERL